MERKTNKAIRKAQHILATKITQEVDAKKRADYIAQYKELSSLIVEKKSDSKNTAIIVTIIKGIFSLILGFYIVGAERLGILISKVGLRIAQIA